MFFNISKSTQLFSVFVFELDLLLLTFFRRTARKVGRGSSPKCLCGLIAAKWGPSLYSFLLFPPDALPSHFPPMYGVNRLRVRKKGVNKGKPFFKCRKPKASQCKFFMWAKDVPKTNLNKSGGRSKMPGQMYPSWRSKWAPSRRIWQRRFTATKHTNS